jgi:hypothetical protein
MKDQQSLGFRVIRRIVSRKERERVFVERSESRRCVMDANAGYQPKKGG